MHSGTFVKGFHDEYETDRMIYNQFGDTKMKVSHISFGGGALGDFYEPYEEKEAIQTVRSALRRGINFIDTAPYYGKDRKSEKVLGKALCGMPRRAYYICTKVGRYSTDVLTGFDFSYDATIKSVEESLKNLQLEYVDVIHVHDVEFAPTRDIILNETLPALHEIVKAGKARYIGITGYILSELVAIVESSTIPIDCVLSYARCTLFDTSLKDGEHLSIFKNYGLGVISAAGIGMGLLNDRGPFALHPAHQEIKDACAAAREHCKDKGMKIGRLAAYYTMRIRGPDTHLLGICNMEILNENLDVLVKGISPEEKETMFEIIDKYFSPLSIHHWEGVELVKYRAEYNRLKAEQEQKHLLKE